MLSKFWFNYQAKTENHKYTRKLLLLWQEQMDSMQLRRKKNTFFFLIAFFPLQATLLSASSDGFIYLINFVMFLALISETDRYKNI